MIAASPARTGQSCLPRAAPAGSVRPGRVGRLREYRQGGPGRIDLTGALILEPGQNRRVPGVNHIAIISGRSRMRTDPVAGRLAAAGHRDHGKEG